MPERRVKAPLIPGCTSTAMARAMASICNDEQRYFGVQEQIGLYARMMARYSISAALRHAP